MLVTERVAYQLLANAIVLQAVKDYRSAIIEHDDYEQVRLERWFSLTWCKMLSGLEPEIIIRAALGGHFRRCRDGALHVIIPPDSTLFLPYYRWKANSKGGKTLEWTFERPVGLTNDKWDKYKSLFLPFFRWMADSKGGKTFEWTFERPVGLTDDEWDKYRSQIEGIIAGKLDSEYGKHYGTPANHKISWSYLVPDDTKDKTSFYKLSITLESGQNDLLLSFDYHYN